MSFGREKVFAMNRAAEGSGVAVWMLVQGKKEKRGRETGLAGCEVGAAGDGDSKREKKGKKIC